MNDNDRPPNPDRFLVKDAWDRKLCGIGVPKQYWEPDIRKIKFSAVSIGKITLSPEAQLQWISSLSTEPTLHPLVLITSKPTDQGALYVAYYLAQSALRAGKNFTSINTARKLRERLPFYPHYVLIHNILSKATPERMQDVRDLLTRFEKSFRMVVAVAVPDPYPWFVSNLGLHPTIVLKAVDHG